jgi:hypothetical protein
MSEAGEQSRIMLALGGHPSIRIFRNNVGLARFPDGSTVRYGLCPGSADLIGWRTVTVTPDMVGQTFAQFLSVECKAPKGKTTDKQEAWFFAVKRGGGVALVARSVDDVKHLLG